MKKIFTRFACATLMLAGALTADATLYVCGANVNGKTNQWTPATPVTIEAVDGFYTFTAIGEFKMSSAKGTWDAFNAAAKGATASSWKVSGNSATANLVATQGNSSAPNAWAASEVTYKVNEAFTTITASVGSVSKVEFYVTGSAFGGWGEWTDEYKMTETSDNVFTYVAENGITGEWKICGKDYTPNFGAGEGQPQANEVYYPIQNSSNNLSTTFSDKCVITFTYNPDTNSGTILISGQDTPVDYTGWYLNIVGDFNGWNDEGVSFNADGTAKRENIELGANGFKVKLWTGSADMWRCNGQQIPCDEWVAVENNVDQLMTIAGAGDGDVFDIEFNAVNNEIYVTLKQSALEAPETVYLMGNVNGTNWTLGQQVEMTKDNDANIWRVNANIDDADNGNGYFTFVTSDASDWDGSDDTPGINGSDRFGAPEANFPASTDAENTVTVYRAGVNASSANSWTIPAGAYNFAFDFDNMSLAITKVDNDDPFVATFNFNDPTSLDPSYPAFPANPEAELPSPWKKDQTNYMIELAETIDDVETPVVFTSNGVTLTQVKNEATNSTYRIYRQASGVQELRWFKNTRLKITAPSLHCIKKVEFFSPRTAAQSKLSSVTVGSTEGPKLTAIENTEIPEGQTAGMVYVPDATTGTTSVEFYVTATTSAQLINVYFAQVQDAVDGIVTDDDADAPVYYYNLQGVRVANPENGVFIRVQVKNATKVIIR